MSAALAAHAKPQRRTESQRKTKSNALFVFFALLGDLCGFARSKKNASTRRGQAITEFAVLYAGVILPLTFMTFFVAQALWIWHGMVEFTRDGARFAVTHYCGQADGNNVVTYMQTHVPPVIDQNQFQIGGGATINVQFLDSTGAPFNNPDCSDCVPDSVSVSVTNYTFGRLAAFLKLPGISMPPFTTNLPMESAGLDPQGNSVCQ